MKTANLVRSLIECTKDKPNCESCGFRNLKECKSPTCSQLLIREAARKISEDANEFAALNEYFFEMHNVKKDTMNIALDHFAVIPTRAHDTDAGIDLKSPDRYTVKGVDVVGGTNEGAVWGTIEVGKQVVDTGVHVQLPKGTVGMIKAKSSLYSKGIYCEGVIDEGYTGSIKVVLYNHTPKDFEIRKGDKIAQLVILPCLTPELKIVDSLEETERGDGGFGSTGR